MEDRRISLIWSGLILAVFLLLAGLFWANQHLASLPAVGEDFLPAWVGTRLFLQEGNLPYGEQASAAIREEWEELSNPPNRQPLPFLYPFYAVLVFAPFALVPDFPLALRLWVTALEVSLLLVCLAGVALSRWRLSWVRQVGLALILSLSLYYSYPVLGGQSSALVALFLVGAFFAIRSQHDVLGGFLLALATIKPHIVVLLFIFILLWAASWRRWQLFWSSILFIIVFIGIFSLFQPSWLLQYGRELLIYWLDAPPYSPGSFAFESQPGVGRQVGWALSVFVLGNLLIEWRAALRQDFRHFYWTACLTLVLTPLSGVPGSMENYALLIPALVLVLSIWSERWGGMGRGMILFSLTALLLGGWAWYLRLQQNGGMPEQSIGILLALPVFLWVGLYWVRWWGIRPPRTQLEMFSREVR